MTVRLNMSGHPNPGLAQMGFVDLPLQVDLADPNLPARLTQLMADQIGDDPDVVVALPGLAPLAALTLAIIHGLTGAFPRVQPLIRDGANWVPGPVLDLQQVRNDARQARPGVIVL